MITLENSKFLGPRKGIDFEFHLLHLKNIFVYYILFTSSLEYLVLHFYKKPTAVINADK